MQLVRRHGVDPSSLQAIEWELRTWEMLNELHGAGRRAVLCPPSPETDGEASPQQAASSFIRRFPLPPPQPRLAPGYALTGLPTYLELDGPAQVEVVRAVPSWGELTVTFELAGIEVAWGDGRTSSHPGPALGAPFDGDPAARIAHIYRYRDPDVEVVVTAHWRAAWQLADHVGQVDGLAITRAAPHPVVDRIAVRSSPRFRPDGLAEVLPEWFGAPPAGDS